MLCLLDTITEARPWIVTEAAPVVCSSHLQAIACSYITAYVSRRITLQACHSEDSVCTGKKVKGLSACAVSVTMQTRYVISRPVLASYWYEYSCAIHSNAAWPVSYGYLKGLVTV